MGKSATVGDDRCNYQIEEDLVAVNVGYKRGKMYLSKGYTVGGEDSNFASKQVC